MTSLLWIGVLVVYAVISCTGLYLIKTASGYFTLVFFGGAALYILGAGIWIVALRHLPISIAFPVAAGCLMLATTSVGIICLGETVSLVTIAGMLLIAAGIASISYSMVR